jgi:hypothetical protein
VQTSELKIATVSAPTSLAANNQFLAPSFKFRICCSTEILLIGKA